MNIELSARERSQLVDQLWQLYLESSHEAVRLYCVADQCKGTAHLEVLSMAERRMEETAAAYHVG